LPEKKRTTVSVPCYVWEKLAGYFEEHQNELLEKGIKSPSKLASTWIEESHLRARAIEDGYLRKHKK
jgi:hypothetical protein